MLFLGFWLDYFTFTNIQINITLGLLLAYWFIAGVSIVFILLYDAGKLSEKLRYIRLFSPLLIQLTFGAMLGGPFVFYWFSGSFWVSWPLILLVLGLMVSNEVFRHHFLKPKIQISIYFYITISLFSLVLPFIFHSLSPWLFVIAGLLSLIFIFLFILLLSSFRYEIKQQWKFFVLWISIIFLCFNFLYFTNIIPPIPLSIKEARVYHNVQRSGGSYILKGETETFWQKLVPGQTLHLSPDERAYVYTAIFAPTELNTKILHEWQYYDGQKKAWVTRDNLSFNLVGGRKQGFRGYSWKSALTPGEWRIFVKTERGQTLGRIKFKIDKVEVPVEFKEIVR